jgi:preprotein translocase subunit SecD
MRDDDPVIAALVAADPHPGGADPLGGEPELAQVREQIMATPTSRLGRHWRPRASAGPLLAVGSVIAVAAIVVLFLHVGSSARRGSALSPGAGTSRIVLRLEPSVAGPHVTAAAVREEVRLLRAQVGSLGVVGITVRRVGTVEIAVTIPFSERVGFITRYLTTTPTLAFTDWEANVIAPNGHTVASQNLHRDAAAELLSQGGAAQNPGSPDAGAVTLERAVALAARQPHRPDAPTLSRLGSEWFAFTRTGPGGCRAASSTCYQSGPTPSRGALHARSGERVLAVPQGTVVVQATSSTVTGTDYRDPAARFFVLRDNAAPLGAQLTDAHAATSDDGQSVIDVTFTRRGARALHDLTATVAHRGERLTIGAAPEYQHFAVILDGSLLSVPALNYHSYPDGLTTANRTGEILGDFTPTSARRIATELRLGLPLTLRVVSHS